eukprot:1630191-Prymnesium_polylepis.1
MDDVPEAKAKPEPEAIPELEAKPGPSAEADSKPTTDEPKPTTDDPPKATAGRGEERSTDDDGESG